MKPNANVTARAREEMLAAMVDLAEALRAEAMHDRAAAVIVEATKLARQWKIGKVAGLPDTWPAVKPAPHHEPMF